MRSVLTGHRTQPAMMTAQQIVLSVDRAVIIKHLHADSPRSRSMKTACREYSHWRRIRNAIRAMIDDNISTACTPCPSISIKAAIAPCVTII